jgi:poly(A) polymerase
MDMKKKILSDAVNRWVFNQSPKDTYLVGGYIRDLLRGETPEDRDFVLKKDAQEIARKAAKTFGGRVIDLHNKQTFRVSLKGGNFIDFSPLKNNIMHDLQSRDFSINALAWSPDSDMISPLHSAKDIEKRIIRHMNPQNLLDDPLRILRAYRLSAQLDFTILDATRRLLKNHSEKILSPAPERITEELFKLLNCDNAFYSLQLCAEDNVLSRIAMLSNYNININLHMIQALDRLIQKDSLKNKRIHILNYLQSELSQGLNRFGFIRFYLLMRKYSKQGKRLYNIESVSGILQKNNSIRVSSRIRKSFHSLEKSESLSSGRITDKRLYRTFRYAGECIYEIAIIQSIVNPRNLERLLRKADEFMHQRNKTLLNGRDIQKIAGTAPGIIIGEIKDRLLEHQFRGKIRNRHEAREFVIRNFT